MIRQGRVLQNVLLSLQYFDDRGKNMSFVTDDEKVYENYNEIWNLVKSLLKLKFSASPIRDDKYILAKLKIFKKKNLTTFKNNNIAPTEKLIKKCTRKLI